MPQVYIRARDVRHEIRAKGFETGVTYLLERICEENAGHRQALAEAIQMLHQVVDNLDNFTKIAEGMKVKLLTLERVREQDNQLPPSND